MKVTIETYTKEPLAAISTAAGTCYGNRSYSEKRIRNCFDKNHMSVFEQASVQFYVEGISRSCSHQFVRHRLNSYCQESQRYCKVDTESDDWYVMPPAFEHDPEWAKWYRHHMSAVAQCYRLAIYGGAKREDARFLLPESCKTNLTVTMNIRNLYHFWDLRLDQAAQWEIREVAAATLKACQENPDLKLLADLYIEKAVS